MDNLVGMVNGTQHPQSLYYDIIFYTTWVRLHFPESGKYPEILKWVRYNYKQFCKAEWGKGHLAVLFIPLCSFAGIEDIRGFYTSFPGCNHWLCWCWKSLSWCRQCSSDLCLIPTHHVMEIRSPRARDSFPIPTFLDRFSLESTHVVLLIMLVISDPLIINYFRLETVEMVFPSCSQILPRTASAIRVSGEVESLTWRLSTVPRMVCMAPSMVSCPCEVKQN